MLDGKVPVKGLDAESGVIFGEAPSIHESDSPQPPDIAIVQVAPVVEREMECGIGRLVRRKRSTAEKQRAGEAWLHDDPIAAVQIDDDELGTTPGANDGSAHCAPSERVRIDLAQ